MLIKVVLVICLASVFVAGRPSSPNNKEEEAKLNPDDYPKWTVGVSYRKGDTVNFNGNLFVAMRNTVADPQQIMNPNLLNFYIWVKIYNANARPKQEEEKKPAADHNEWKVGTSYFKGDIVNFNGDLFRAMRNNVAVEEHVMNPHLLNFYIWLKTLNHGKNI